MYARDEESVWGLYTSHIAVRAVGFLDSQHGDDLPR